MQNLLIFHIVGLREISESGQRNMLKYSASKRNKMPPETCTLYVLCTRVQNLI